MKIGTCKLCLVPNVELKRSHYLPAAAYRLLRDEHLKNPNPWAITERAEFQSSDQMRAPLLCRVCEKRFHENGEDYFFRKCLRKDGQFPLANLLTAKRPDVTSAGNATKVYHAAKVPEINIQALAYFATSIFWRGSIHPWNLDGSVPVELGPYRESLRKYLMGVTGFPTNFSLSVVLRDKRGTFDRLMYAPIGKREEGCHVYKFPLCGFGFSLAVGKIIPVTIQKTCFVRGPGNPIVLTPILDYKLEQDVITAHQRSQNFQNRRLDV